MGVPARRVSKQKKRQRRAHWKIDAPELTNCPQCHELMAPHRVCPSCGYYKGREVVAVK
ncbi:50S ribosomal protein L32 [Sporotomaculum syntrophicum]|uniref:Large ribosomal subunit protein bL32 n=1 Tax=Sporotomaculum syntrophicum TaxID=182264 RepID=A0A9D2WSP7_9FIRM|nr:50S ribosomal protein L32 [Sporotomaculum syntrophicum]KAF1086739.1 50S ribosomal protein L32 [Sporotomaculum syntrophicum]